MSSSEATEVAAADNVVTNKDDMKETTPTKQEEKASAAPASPMTEIQHEIEPTKTAAPVQSEKTNNDNNDTRETDKEQQTQSEEKTKAEKPALQKDEDTSKRKKSDHALSKRSDESTRTTTTTRTEDLLEECVMEIEEEQSQIVLNEMEETQRQKEEEESSSIIPSFLKSLLITSYQELLGDSSTGAKGKLQGSSTNSVMGITKDKKAKSSCSIDAFEPDPFARDQEDDEALDLIDADPARLRSLIKKLNAIDDDDDKKETDKPPPIEEENDETDESPNDDDEQSYDFGDNIESVLFCDFIIIARGETDKKWDLLLKQLQSLTPSQAKEAAEADQSRYHTTPLHLACRRRPPLSVIQSLIKASPQVLSWHDRNSSHPKWLPLHCAAEYRASQDVLQELIAWYPPALTAKTKLGMTPLHLACAYQQYHGDMPSFEVMNILSSNNKDIRKEKGYSNVLACLNKDGLTPLDVFLRSVNFLRFKNDVDRQACSDCARYLIIRSPLNKGRFINSLRIAPRWMTDFCLSLQEVQRLLNDKMTPLATAMLMADFYCYLLLVISYTIVSNSAITSRFENDDNDNDKLGWYVVLFLVTIFLALRELVHVYTQGMFWWLTNVWNWVNGILVVLVLVSGTFMVNGNGDDESIRALCVATGGMVWLVALAFLKSTYLPFSVFISGVIHIFWALIPFTVSVFFVVGAFSQMYYTNTIGSETCADDFEEEGSAFCSYDTSWLQSYSLLINGFADFFFTNGGVQDKPGEVEEYYSQGTLVLSIIYAFLVAFLLQSILIAVVSDAWTAVRQKGEVVFWSHRFNFVSEIERIRIVWMGNFQWVTKLFQRAERDQGRQDGTSKEGDHDKSNDENSYQWQLFWELVVLTYSNHYDGSVVWEEADRMERLRLANSSRDWKMVESSLWFRRVAFLLPVLLWILAGAFTFGAVWPKSVRTRLFCAPTSGEDYRASHTKKEDSEETPLEESENTVLDQKLEELRDVIKAEIASLRKELLKEMGRIQP